MADDGPAARVGRTPPRPEGDEMLVGVIFLYLLWGLIAVGAVVATVMVLHDGD